MSINLLANDKDLVRAGFSTDFKHAGGLVQLRNETGMEATFTPYGLRLLRLKVPNLRGSLTSVVLGYRSLEEYMYDKTYQGAVVGRNANRIADARYTDPDTGSLVELLANNDGNNLHGGDAWSNAVWTFKEKKETELGSSATFYLIDPEHDGKGTKRFPGNMYVKCTVTLTTNNELLYSFRGLTDRLTVWNPTTHPYFNLNGELKEDVRNHVLKTNADRHLVVDPRRLVPISGKAALALVKDSRYDFTAGAVLGDKFSSIGFDDCFVFPKGDLGQFVMYSPVTGIMMGAVQDTLTRSAQFYTGYFLDGRPAPQFGGFCWEPGTLVDAPNQPELCRAVGVNPLLKPGEIGVREIGYHFTVRK